MASVDVVTADVRAMMQKVTRFNMEIIGLPIAESPRCLEGKRLQYSVEHLQEEVGEFFETSKKGDTAEAADALLDLVYVALGRLLEMGVPPGPQFDEVHEANMGRARGERSKRPHSLGFDAVKPDGWVPPDHDWLLRATPSDILALKRIMAGDYQAISHQDLLNMEDTSKFSPVLLEVVRLRVKKDPDYNNGGVKLVDYFPFGHVSYAQMLHVKSLRVRSLVGAGRMENTNFESLRDTLVDMINYSTYYVEAIDRGDFTPVSRKSAE